jgi:hypothetical protein
VGLCFGDHREGEIMIPCLSDLLFWQKMMLVIECGRWGEGELGDRKRFPDM